MAETNLDVKVYNPNAVQIAQDAGLIVARGLVDGQSSGDKFGKSETITNSEQVIWDSAVDYTFLDAEEYINIVSNSTLDTYGTGTRAWTIYLAGLDDNYNRIEDLVQLDGTNIVSSHIKFKRLYRAIIIHGGSAAGTPVDGANAGTISLTSAVTAKLQAQILPANGQTMMCVLTVPAGYTMYVTSLSYASAQRDDVLVEAKFRNAAQEDGGVFSIKYADVLYQSIFNNPFSIPVEVPEKTDMVVTAKTIGVATAIVTSAWDYILVEDD